MTSDLIKHQIATTNLQKSWYVFIVGSLGVILVGFGILYSVWEPLFAVRWILLTSPVALYQIWLLGKNLPNNHRIGEKNLLPGLGIGNILTLVRGLLFAMLTGFLFSPQPLGGLAWIPAILYTAGALIDFLDGYAARVSNQVTKLGEILDMSMDGWGMLVASFLAVQYGQVPGWYVFVGLARYLYVGGLWVWERLGEVTYELPPNNTRRPFAGLQMGFAFVILWPVFTPPGTHIAAAIFALPFLIGFSWDWLNVSGIVKVGAGRRFETVKRFATEWLPLFFRLCIPILMIWQYVGFDVDLDTIAQSLSANLGAGTSLLLVVLILFDILIPFSLLIGAAGRIAGILGLIILGVHQSFSPLTGIQIALLGSYGFLMYFGTGRFSIWKPENGMIYRRAGE